MSAAEPPTAVRPEHPRPQLVRARWTSLNGPWSFRTDPEDRGVAIGWTGAWPPDSAASVVVPFAPQSSLSGFESQDDENLDIVWYQREITRPADAADDEEVLLHFGACDHRTQVWLDETYLGEHVGGHLPFTFEIGRLLTGDRHRLTVRADDPIDAVDLARGKQHWRAQGEGIFYTPTTGIWQSVWLEPVPHQRIRTVHSRSDIGRGLVAVTVATTGVRPGTTVELEVCLGGDRIASGGVSVDRSGIAALTLPLGRGHRCVSGGQLIDGAGVALWSPDDPQLYDATVRLLDAQSDQLDVVETYFGMRSVEIVDGRWCLNGRPFEQRLVLDQGYWPDGLMTAPTDAHLRRDVELAKELGFNGARKHQKIEDPRYLYWADRLGLLVWEEVPSGYAFSERLVRSISDQLIGMIDRDRSHPCVVAWVPMNESWGVPDLAHQPRQRALLHALYHLAGALDGDRPVISNDGWEQVETDIVSVHDYRSASDIAAGYRAPVDQRWNAGRRQFVGGATHHGQPQLLTEFGGVTLERSDAAWGYATASDGDELVRTFADLVGAIRGTGQFQGYCYTQLTDVETETNGIAGVDRVPKCDVAKWRAVNDGNP